MTNKLYIILRNFKILGSFTFLDTKTADHISVTGRF
jgi:hypothetical protein